MYKKIITGSILIIAILFALFFLKDKFTYENLKTFIKNLGIYAPLGFLAIYILATVLMLPGSILTILGGFIFGPVFGVLYSLIAATIGATLAFLLAKFMLSDWVQKKAKGKLKQVVVGIEKNGWKFVALLRIAPIIPFNLLNYTLGLTKINVFVYMATSFVFMFPGCFAYTYLGYLGEAAVLGEKGLVIKRGLIAVGLLVFISSFPWIIKKFKEK